MQEFNMMFHLTRTLFKHVLLTLSCFVNGFMLHPLQLGQPSLLLVNSKLLANETCEPFERSNRDLKKKSIILIFRLLERIFILLMSYQTQLIVLAHRTIHFC